MATRTQHYFIFMQNRTVREKQEHEQSIMSETKRNASMNIFMDFTNK